VKWLKVSLVVGLLGAAFFAARNIDFAAGWRIVSSLSPLKIFVIVIFLPLAGNLATALRWQLILRALGYSIGLGKLIRINLAGFAASTLIPSLDLAGRSAQILLASKEGLPAATALVSVSLDAIIGSGADLLLRVLLLSTLGLIGSGNGFGPVQIIAALVIVAGALATLILAPLIHPILPKSIGEYPAVKTFFERLADARARFADARQRRWIVLAAAAAIVFFGLGLAEMAIIAQFVGVRPSAQNLLLAQTAYRYAGLMPAASLGALERTLVDIFWENGGENGIALALALRFKDLPWILTGILILAASGALRRKK